MKNTRNKLKLTLNLLVLILLSSFVFAGLSDGILVAYNFEQNYNTTNLTNQVDNTKNNSYSVQVTAKPTGVSGDGWDFEQGSGDEVLIDGSFLNGRTAFSYFCWFNFESLCDTCSIWTGQTHSGDYEYRGYMYTSVTGTSAFRIATGTTTINDCNSADKIFSVNNWILVGMTFNASRVHVFINDTENCNTATTNPAIYMLGNWELGYTTQANTYDGIMDECYLWDRNLTRTEITKLYARDVDSFYPFTIPNIAPNIPTITSPYNNEINNTRKIEFNTSDDNNDAVSFTIYINGTYNISTTTNITIWNSSDGVYNLTMTANDSSNVSANTSSFIFTLDTVPPHVEIIFPINNASNLSLDLNATAWDNLSSSLTFYWVINGTTNTTTTDANSSFTGSHGYYNLTLFVSDGLQNNSNTVFFNIDTIRPTITMIYPASDNSTRIENIVSIITLNSTFNDERDLYSYNVSIYRIYDNLLLFNESSDSLTGTSYFFTAPITITGWENTSYREEITVCDSHTSLLIKNADIIKRTDELIFQFDNTILSIQSIGGNEFSSNTEKKIDKYTFSFGYSKKTTEKIYKITSNKKIDYLPHSKYKGHFVIGNELWLDFENNFDNDVVIINVNGTYYAHITNNENYIIFSSVGYLNCITEHYSFVLTSSPLTYDINLIVGDWFNTDILNTSTTAGVLLFFFLFFVLVVLVVFTEYVKIPAFALLTGIYGIFLGFLLYVIISAIMGFMIIIMSIFYLIALIRFT